MRCWRRWAEKGQIPAFCSQPLHTSPCSQAELQAGKDSLPAVKTIKNKHKGAQTPLSIPLLSLFSLPQKATPPSYSFFPCTLISATYWHPNNATRTIHNRSQVPHGAWRGPHSERNRNAGEYGIWPATGNMRPQAKFPPWPVSGVKPPLQRILLMFNSENFLIAPSSSSWLSLESIRISSRVNWFTTMMTF